MNAEPSATGTPLRRISRVAGPLLALGVYLMLPDRYPGPEGAEVLLPHAARATVAMLVWMAIWWMTEAVPIEATSLLPVVMFPLFGVAPVGAALSPYASDVIFLFLGGFILAAAMTRWGLDRRIAFATLRVAGSSPDRITAAVMIATAFVSMWVSNTATAAMMVPIALSLIRVAGEGQASRRFAIGLLLSVAYAASIGGVATLIGSPPNGIVARYLAQAGFAEISFAQWLAIGMPLALIMLPLVWILLTQVLFRHGIAEIGGGRSLIERASHELGPLSRGEWATVVAFGGAVLLWLTRPLLQPIEIAGARPFAGLSDATIAVAAALSLFVWPAGRDRGGFAMDWPTAVRIPWGVLLLFGGGLSLAAAIEANGVTALIASQVGMAEALPGWVALGSVVTASVFVSEVTSNTAQVAATTPLLAGIAPGLGVDARQLVIASAMGASCAFMMPVGTPPNAIVFGTGHLTIGQMCRAGFLLNLIAVAVITAYASLWLPLVLR